LKAINIAGTNGKGSVSLKTAKALEYAGYKTGLYISPHISCFRERISINGEKISVDETAKYG
jgi:dihydrofolate synthase/folylpolyglutamate synthase